MMDQSSVESVHLIQEPELPLPVPPRLHPMVYDGPGAISCVCVAEEMVSEARKGGGKQATTASYILVSSQS